MRFAFAFAAWFVSACSDCPKDTGGRRFESGTHVGFVSIEGTSVGRRVDVDRVREIVKISWIENGKVIVETHRVVRVSRGSI
jgi:hypothetical protein